MTRLINLLRNMAFPVAIAVALTFGATQAVGQMLSCPYSPPDHLGECIDDDHCGQLCDPYDPEFWDCDFNNCCGCFF